VRVSEIMGEGPMEVNFDCGSMQKEAAICVGCYARRRRFMLIRNYKLGPRSGLQPPLCHINEPL